jgi:acetylornithine deacetylase
MQRRSRAAVRVEGRADAPFAPAILDRTMTGPAIGQLTMSAPELAAWTQAFVRHPSPQTERFEHDPQVQSFIGETVAPLAKKLGLPCRRDAMGNLLIEIGPARSGRGLMLMAYAMTHPANRMVHPFGGELIEGGLYVRGRGVSEQKGALAAALAAVSSAAARLDLRGRLVLAVSTAGETGRHDAALSICDALAEVPPLAVMAVGTGGRVALANKGRVDVVVTVRGKAAHSSMPWTGIDAVAGARLVLDRVAGMSLGTRTHPGLGAPTLTATSLRSWPEATHTVQDEVRLVLDRRLLPGDDPQSAFAAIATAVAIGEPWQVTAELGPVMHPAEIAPDGPFMRAVRGGCRRMGLPPPTTFYSHGALDAGLFCARGAESAMWGPGVVEHWHGDDERIAVADLLSGSLGYLGMIQEHLAA